ncbi:MAG TPA: glucose-6-phosphate dehydrogenase assembly protein OpcA [Nocardioidaceae bacterium]|nr:glucose-6-phosphate dehydrogenase assembly protein OpcA [Nocardioidaceae bacterium]
MISLTDTTSSEIAAEFLNARRRAGSPAMGMVMTLVVVVEEEGSTEAMSVARKASREHPARLLGVVHGDGRGAPQIDAEVGVGAGASGEQALIRLAGSVTKHAESVVLPLLLPDSPVVVWWPGRCPDNPAGDPIGALGTRRITDAASAPTARAKAMLTQCLSYEPGNTDFAWTRITGWRALLAAALDQHPGRVEHASVTAERISPSADLLSAWLADRLRVDVARHNSEGPGITHVVLTTKLGDVSLVRLDGRLATLSSPGQPDRPVALKRREPDQLLSEELRRLDPDEIYAATVKRFAKRMESNGSARRRRSAGTGTSTRKGRR